MVCGANQTDHHLTGIDVRRDLAIDSFTDLAQVEAGDACANCGQMLAVRRGIEVGNIFQLGTRYAQSMGLTYTDEQGQAQVPYMGCYGIGIGRLLACILEAHCSDRGPVWPFAVAPWLYHICLINSKDPDVWAAGDALYQALNQADLALLDDRPVSAGIQFADADLLGAPIRVIVGKRHLQNGQVEVMNRVTGTSSLVALAQAADYCREWVSSATDNNYAGEYTQSITGITPWVTSKKGFP
jgi:prolyl-tRNA synthetase